MIVGILLCGALAQGYGESPYIFGVHDPGGEGHMTDKGKKGWIVFTEELGRNPADMSGKSYTSYADAGFGVIVRLNHGYGPTNGTLPHSWDYDDFAQRVANFVANSPGAHIWIIGNETNLSNEWPKYSGTTEPITADKYAACYKKCRDKIKALPGHGGDQVVVAAVGTWNVEIGYGWIEYFQDILNAIGSGAVDAIALHTYTHGSDPNLVFSDQKMDPPYDNRYYHFRAYRDFMNAIPAWGKTLPVYITETDQNDPWADINSGWVKNAYKEINDWNSTPGNQKLRALCLYRWPNYDVWGFETKMGVIQDWREAMDNSYTWTAVSEPPSPPAPSPAPPAPSPEPAPPSPAPGPSTPDAPFSEGDRRPTVCQAAVGDFGGGWLPPLLLVLMAAFAWRKFRSSSGNRGVWIRA